MDDIREIELLQRTFALYNDRCEWERLANLFEEQGCLIRPSDPNHPIQGRHAILQSFLARATGLRRRHFVADTQVRLLDDNNAHAYCHSILIEEVSEGCGKISVGGFNDILRRASEGWRFISRSGFVKINPTPFSEPTEPGLSAVTALFV